MAIVGCGPKGLFALERLVAIARKAKSGQISVDVYEPHPAPGAGPVYDPDQPEYLRMNFAAGQVDMWPPGSNLGPSFSEWRGGVEDVSDEDYPPRAHVGRYLASGFRSIVEGADERCEVEVKGVAVERIRDEGGSWSVGSRHETASYDEVLVATGHANRWDGALGAAWSQPQKLVSAVFPVETALSEATVPRSSVVAVRGFALTMIDAALALTEGRGGRFGRGDEPYLLRYEPGDADVSRIQPFSRTGRPMLAKPDPSSARRSDRLNRIASGGRAALTSLPCEGALEAACGILGEVAAESLRAVGGDQEEITRTASIVADAQSGRAMPVEASPAEEIKRSIAVAVGAGEPGADWALGHAWRVLYPAIVARLGATGLERAEWPAFRRLATEMERISFGPPPVNAAKLLALVECGRVDLSCLTSGPAPEAEIVIDAVIPPPGVRDGQEGPAGLLVRDGFARTADGRRGVELAPDVTCVGADGLERRGLSVIGRATEDWVIGNDTLNRALHPQAELWARRVVERARS